MLDESPLGSIRIFLYTKITKDFLINCPIIIYSAYFFLKILTCPNSLSVLEVVKNSNWLKSDRKMSRT